MKKVKLYASFPFGSNVISTVSNGTSGGKNVILTQTQPFPLFPEHIEEDTPQLQRTEVVFEKNLEEVFLDYDDNDLSEFGIDMAKEAVAVELDIEKFEASLCPYSIANLERFGLSVDDSSWYGCYVLNIKHEEIICINNIFKPEQL